VVVLGLAVGFAEDAVIDRDLAVSIGPQESDQVDAQDDLMMLPRPVTDHQLDVLGMRLVEGRVVDDEDALGLLDQWFGLIPERLGIGFKAMEQSCKRGSSE
jgi:hypothetical protein